MHKQIRNLVLAGSLASSALLSPLSVMAAAAAPQAATTAVTLERPARPVTPTGGRQAPVAPAVTPIPAYDAAVMITTFAAAELGTTPTILKAVGGTGSVTLPPAIQATLTNTVALAGQAAVGAITINGAPGAAQVAVGSGTISGNLEADITAASLGAYSLLLPATAMPTDANAALALIRQQYPGLSTVGLTPIASEQGYRFRAETTTQHLDPKTMTVTVVTTVVIAGVNGQGKATAVWTVVGNGEFATALKNLGS